MITMTEEWFTYVDWTLEQFPRPFYVGKGNAARVADKINRNAVWHRIANKHGCHREIVFSSSIEQHCFDHEQKLIAELKTFPNLEEGWGANLCLGGPGPTGARWSQESKDRLSDSVKSLWTTSSYRKKLMVMPAVSVEQLQSDGIELCWDDIASKYDVSATTVKRWFRELGITKQSVKQRRTVWKISDDQQLAELYDSGKLVREIANVMQRSECSVKKRIQRMCDKRGIKRARYRRKT